MADVSPAELEALLVRGWRRFGAFYLRPACAACVECVSLRLPVARFTPTDSQRRALRRARRFRVELGRPRLDGTRVALHRAWQAARSERRGWPLSPIDEDDYALQLAYPHEAAREVAWYDGERLVAAGLCDVTPNAWSLVQFFYDPAISRLSPGVANVAVAVELARARGIGYVYLGYRVLGCASMRYKATFGPHELLEGRPADDEAPVWKARP